MELSDRHMLEVNDIVGFFYHIVKYNEYYGKLRAWIKKHRLGLKKATGELFDEWRSRRSSMSPYAFLDSCEDFLGDEIEFGRDETVGSLIDSIAKKGEWRLDD